MNPSDEVKVDRVLMAVVEAFDEEVDKLKVKAVKQVLWRIQRGDSTVEKELERLSNDS